MTSPAPSTGSWLPWVQPSVQAMPLTTDPAFIGHQFKYDGTRYTIYRTYDLLAIPAMTSEVERAFSGAKNTLDDKRTKLGPAVFEATELDKHWMKAGLGDDLGPSGHLSGYLTSDGKEVRPEALWGYVGRPEDLDSDVEPE